MTTYYVRTIADSFNFEVKLTAATQTYGYSRNSHFELYVEPALSGADYEPWGIRANRMFTAYNQVLFAFFEQKESDNMTNRVAPPSKTNVNDFRTLRQSDSSGTIYWCSKAVNIPSAIDTYYVWGDTGWVDQGWSSPEFDYNDYINELCTAFDNINKNSVVTSNSNINLVVFKYRFLNEGKHRYFPVFYVGNDPNADTTVTI